MEKSFLFYLLCIIAILMVLVLICIRNSFIAEYQDTFLNVYQEPLKYIPKKLFQLLPDKNKITEKFQKNIDFNRRMNPDWNYYLLDDKDIEAYIAQNYGDCFMKYYNKINPKYGACRADFFRYLLMYKEGGVYLDIKSAAEYPLSTIILPDDEYLLAYWDFPTQSGNVGSSEGEFQQWHIICRPQHPFLRIVIEKMLQNIDNYTEATSGTGKMAVLKLTGPIMYTLALKPVLSAYPHRIIELNQSVGLIYNNLDESHKSLFSKTHYSKINEPVIINKDDPSRDKK